LSEATVLILAAAIGAVGALIGAFVGAWAQHRFTLQQRRLEAQEAEQRRLEEKRIADEKERHALLRLLTDPNEDRNARELIHRLYQDDNRDVSRGFYGRPAVGALDFQQDLHSAPIEYLRQLLAIRLVAISTLESGRCWEKDIRDTSEQLQQAAQTLRDVAAQVSEADSRDRPAQQG
jgi:hypothetical protein